MKIVHALILSAVPLSSAACAGAPPSDASSEGRGEVTDTAEQALLDPICYQGCVKKYCRCLPDDKSCLRCERGCAAECTVLSCQPNCAGATCGAADGCGGTCTSGSCPMGEGCGVGGTLGQCASLPDLSPSVTGTLQLVGFNGKQGDYTLRIRNLSPSDVTNVKILIETNLQAGLLSLTPTGGFACYLPSGYYPRLGLECVGGKVLAYNETVIQLSTSLSVSGPNVLSVFADPDNTIPELFENNNLANVALMVP